MRTVIFCVLLLLSGPALGKGKNTEAMQLIEGLNATMAELVQANRELSDVNKEQFSKTMELASRANRLSHKLEFHIFFTSKYVSIDKGYDSYLENIVMLTRLFPSTKVVLRGNTDSKGQELDNLKLANERVNSVMIKLVKLGLDQQSLTIQPKSNTMKFENDQLNRRVDVILIP